MGRKLDIKPGDRFGRLTVIEEEPRKKKSRYFLCRCDCGKEVSTKLIWLTTGQSKSCGCLRKERFLKFNTRHGQSHSALHSCWTSMKQRCLNPKNPVYQDYGGRGIKVCPEWMYFEPFYWWAMMNSYDENLTIERKDVNGNYEPKNCCWIPQSQQGGNRRTNKLLTFKGQTKAAFQWAKELGLNPGTVYTRLRLGWSTEEALTGVRND